MIRILDSRPIILDELMYVEYSGESTDEKPTSFGRELFIINGERVWKDIGISTGSVFMEVDTGDVYLFSEKDTSWKKVGE